MRHTIRSFFRLSWYRGFKIKNHILKSSRHFYPTCSQTTFKVQQLSFILTKSCRLTYLQWYRIFSLPNPISDHSFHHHQNFLQNKNLIFTISKLIFEIYTFKTVLVLENCLYLQILRLSFFFLESTVTFFRIVVSTSASVVLASYLWSLLTIQKSLIFPSRQRLSPELNSKNSPFCPKIIYFQPEPLFSRW